LLIKTAFNAGGAGAASHAGNRQVEAEAVNVWHGGF